MSLEVDLRYAINMTACQLKYVDCLMNVVRHIEHKLREHGKQEAKVSPDDISAPELWADDLHTFNNLYDEQVDEI